MPLSSDPSDLGLDSKIIHAPAPDKKELDLKSALYGEEEEFSGSEDEEEDEQKKRAEAVRRRHVDTLSLRWDSQGLGTLCSEIKNNQTEQASRMLRNEGEALLKVAALNSDYKKVKTILQFCNEHPGEFSFSIDYLDSIVENGDFEILELLLKELINTKKEVNPLYKDGNTLLHKLIPGCDFQCTEIIIQELKAREQNPNPPNIRGRTPLHVACKLGYWKIAKFLAQEIGEDIHPHCNKGFTPLHIAVRKNRYRTSAALIGIATTKGKTINPVSTEGEPVFLTAVTHGRTEIVQFMLEESPLSGLNMNAPIGPTGLTPLHRAAELGHKDIVELLIRHVQTLEESISPEMMGPKGEKITPYLAAAHAGALDVVELFLSTPGFQEPKLELFNLIIKPGQTLFNRAVSLKNHTIVERFLPDLIQLWEEQAGRQDTLWKDICLGLVFTENTEQLLGLLATLFQQNSEDPPYKEAASRITLECAVFYKNDKLTLEIISFLKNHININTILHLTRLFKSTPCLCRIQKTLGEEQKQSNIIVHSAISSFQILLKEGRPAQAMPGNEALLLTVQQKYDELDKNIQIGIVQLKTLPQEAVKPYIDSLKESLKHFTKCYRNSQKAFQWAEANLQKQAKEEVAKTLRPFEAKLASLEKDLIPAVQFFCDHFRGTQVQRETLHQHRTATERAIKTVRIEIKNSQYVVSPDLATAAEVLTLCHQSLHDDFLRFKSNDDKKQQAAAQRQEERNYQKIADDIAAVREDLGKQLKNIKKSLQNTHRNMTEIFPFVSGDIQEQLKPAASALEEIKNALICQEEALANPLPPSKAERETLLSTLYKIEFKPYLNTIRAIQAQITKEHAIIADGISAQRQALTAETIVKINEAQSLLRNVLEHPFYKKVMEDPNEVRYQQYTKYQKIFEGLKALTRPELEKKNNSALHDISVKTNRWIRENKASIDDLIATLNDQLAAQVVLPGYRLLSPAADLIRPMRVIRHDRRPPPPFSYQEKQVQKLKVYLKNVLTSLANNLDKDTLTKTNALLFSIATFLEEIKKIHPPLQAYQVNPNFLASVSDIRNAIFHALIESEISLEKYESLYAFTQTLYEINFSQGSGQETLLRFFNIMKEKKPDTASALRIIDAHLKQLDEYVSQIQQKSIDIENELITQFDFAFRWAQSSALLSDLDKMSNQNDALSIEIGRRIARMNKILKISLPNFRACANKLRHEPQAQMVLEEFCVALVTHWSQIEEAQGEEGLPDIRRLSLKAH